MLRTSAAVSTDGGMAPPVQRSTKLANVTHTAGCKSVALNSTAERSPLACKQKQSTDDVRMTQPHCWLSMFSAAIYLMGLRSYCCVRCSLYSSCTARQRQLLNESSCLPQTATYITSAEHTHAQTLHGAFQPLSLRAQHF